jgi:peptidyl-prolyl cis-trans isomerase D
MIKVLQSKNIGAKIMFGVIIGLIVISMVAYLIPDFTGIGAGPAEQGVYATVGGQPITTQEVSKQASSLGRRAMQGRAVPDTLMPYFYRQAADNVILQAALTNEANRLGLKVTDEELARELSTGQFGQQLFPEGKKVDADTYKNWVANTFQLSVPEFERLLKQDLLIRKLQSVIMGGVTVPMEEVQREYTRQNTKVKFDYAVLKMEDIMKKMSVTDAELQAWYEKNKQQFANRIPEQRKAKYVVVDASKVSAQITEDDYKRAYSQRQEQYRVPEEVDVRHILVKTKDEALQVKKQLEGGAKFETLAAKVSEDPGSKDNGGLYQSVRKGVFVKEFDAVSFSIQPGKISDPVQTNFGWHIIKVDARREARMKPLDEVKPELEPIIKSEKAANQLEGLANSVLSEAKSSNLDQAAAKRGLQVINTDFFTQGAQLPGLGANPQAMSQLFTLKAGSAPEKIQLQQGYAIAQVTETKPAATPTFDQVKAQVEQQVRNEKAMGELEKKTRELSDKARGYADLRRAAKEVGAIVMTSQLVDANATVPELGQMSGEAGRAFEMQPKQISDAFSAGRNGVVIALTQKQAPSPAEFESKKDELRTQLLQRKRAEILEMYAQNLRDRLTQDGVIKVNEKEANRLTKGAI